MNNNPLSTLTRSDLCRYHQPVSAASTAYSDFFTLKEHEVIERERFQKMKTTTNLCKEFLIPGIHFMHFICEKAQQEEMAFKSKEPYISMVFCLKNHCTYINQLTNTTFADVNYNEHSLLFISNQETKIQWQSEPGAEVFIINLTIDYFKRFIPQNHPLYQLFESTVYENIPATLGEYTLQIAPRMLTLMYEITQSEQKRYYKRMLIKSKVIELLMLQLEQFEKAGERTTAELLHNIHVEKMYLARDIITSNLGKSCSILDLAQQIGTNDCYLKKHFKQVFGTTVYGYLQKERMERSRKLLLEGEKKISEIARLAGYKHASHFTTAFKKHFGYLPNKIKAILLSLLSEPEVLYLFETPALFARY
ncbi:MAG: helix-turn-helix transcriptional regulator [Chitinophagaceae bacterium]|nr:helix-turn-helix transcriptional regulator [Chitinophagaceae bacterium]